MTNIERNEASGADLIDDLLASYKWDADVITYGFATSAQQYRTSYGYGEPQSGFSELSAKQQDQVQDAINAWAELINLEIVLDNSGDADLMIANSSMPSTAWAYTPGYGDAAGDVWFGTSKGYFTNPQSGNYAKLSMIHELGHALGLSHPHDDSLNGSDTSDASSGFGICPCCGGAVHQNGEHLSAGTTVSVAADDSYYGANSSASDYDAMSYSVMSYSSYVGDSKQGYTNATWDYAQSPMIRDIAAVQYLYGANYETRSDNTTYSWSATTGEKFINGVGQGAPGGNTVFETIWDGGGRDCYDLSNFTSDLTIDLSPGGWTDFGNSQIADLGRGHTAPGNVANALLYQGNEQSLIENAIGGTGDDTITGNSAVNVLIGGLGDDVIDGVAGNNVLAGGTLGDELSFLGIDSGTLITSTPELTKDDGDDTLVGSAGNDIFVAGDGDDVVTGNGGFDTLVFDDLIANISLSVEGDVLVCTYGDGEVKATGVSYIATQDGIFEINDADTFDLAVAKDSISLLYTVGLGREADTAGLAYWLKTVKDGSSIEQVAENVISSEEFESNLVEQGIDTDLDFVQMLYHNLLDREGEQEGIDYWLNELDEGMERASVLTAFSVSDERQSANDTASGRQFAADSDDAQTVDLVAVSQQEWLDSWA